MRVSGYFDHMWYWYYLMDHQMWGGGEGEKKGTIECDKSTVTCDVGTA